MKIRRKIVGSWQVNAYALVCPETSKSLLVDPGAEPNALQKMVENTSPMGIILTHTHADHTGALSVMQDRLKVPIMAHSAAKQTGLPATTWLYHGQRLGVGNYEVLIYHTPGHTEDQICIGIQSHHRMIVGDTIFEGGPGKTWSNNSFRTTLSTLKDIILAWPDNTRCYPGHGDFFDLGSIRSDIEAFIEKDHGNFFGDATWHI